MNVSDLIHRSLRLIGVKDPGQPLDAVEAATGLETVNGIIEQWNSDSRMLRKVLVSATVTPGLQPHTIGTGGTINTARPYALVSASYVEGGQEYCIEPIIQSEWAAIEDKTRTGQPEKIWYDTDYPLGKIYLYPVPATAYALNLWVRAQFPVFALVTDNVDLPPLYEKALAYTAAVEQAPEYGKDPSPFVMKVMNETIGKIKVGNSETPKAGVDPALLKNSTYSLNAFMRG